MQRNAAYMRVLVAIMRSQFSITTVLLFLTILYIMQAISKLVEYLLTSPLLLTPTF